MRYVLCLMVTAGFVSLDAQGAGSAAASKRFITALTGPMDSVNVASIQFSGSGTDSSSGTPVPIKKFTASVNYGIPAMAIEMDGPQARTQIVAGTAAWDVVKGKPIAMPAMRDERARLIWMTPQGAMKAAFDPAGKRTVTEEPGPDGTTVAVVSFLAGGAPVTLRLNGANLIERVESKVGTVTLEMIYSDYRAFDGTQFPTRIVQKRDGQTVLDFTVTDARPNAGYYVEVPASVQK